MKNYYSSYLTIVIFLLNLISVHNYGQLKTQDIRGVVTDKSTNELLIGVNVYVVDSIINIFAVTDTNGEFLLENVPLGRTRIQCSYIGYANYVTPSFMLNSGKGEFLEIYMESDPYKLNEVVVKAVLKDDRTQNEMALLSGRSFSAEETERYAGSIADPSRMAVSFAGVQSSNDLDNDIVIRGNSSVGVLWRLEGIDIPNPNHFSRRGSSGGGVSVFSVNMLRNSDFIYGAPPAEYGNALSGVFDMKFRRGNRNKNEYSIRAGLLGLDATLEGPIKKGNSSYLLNYRYSTLGILNKMGVHLVDSDTDNTFTDLSFHLYFPSSDHKNIFQIWGIGGSSSEFHHPEQDFSQMEEYEDKVQTDFQTSMGVVGLSYTRLMDNKKYVKYKLSLMGDRIIHNKDTINSEGTLGFLNDETYKSSRITNLIEYGQPLGKDVVLKAGAFLTLMGNNLYFTQYDRVDKRLYTHIDNRSSLVDLRLFQTYAQSLWTVNSKLLVTLGLNYLHFSLNGSSSFNYSAAGLYQLNEKNNFSLALGKYAQVIPIGTYYTGEDNLDLPLMQSFQINGAYGWQVRNDFKVAIELYYQKLYNIPISKDVGINYWMLNDLVGYSTENLSSDGTGRNYGIEVTLERFFNRGFFMLLSGSIYNSEYSLGNDDYFDSRYNGRFNSSLMLGKEINLKNENILSLSFRNLIFGGQWYKPPDDFISRAIGEYFEDENSSLILQNKTYWRSDLRVSYRRNNPNNSWILALDVQNLFNISNTRGEIYNLRDRIYQSKSQGGIVPVISFQFDF